MITIQTTTTLLLVILISLCLSHTKAINKKIIKSGQSIHVSETIVSPEGKFELGLFRTKNGNRYVGIRYKNISKDQDIQISEHNCVWVANRDYPVLTPSAVLKINTNGNIEISDGKMSYMVSNVTSSASNVAELLDSGNFVLKENESSENDQYLWQSFDHPTNTLLPGMNLSSVANSKLVSWRSKTDPSPGDFSSTLDLVNKQLIIKKRNNERDSKQSVDSFGLILSKGNLSFYHDSSSSEIFRLVLTDLGEIKRESLNSEEVNENFLTPKHSKHHGRFIRNVLIITFVIVFLVIFLFTVFAFTRIRKRKGKGENLLLFDVEMSLKHNSHELPELKQKRKKGRKKSFKLSFFSYSSVSLATENFSDANKVGEGGFGPVYKGILFRGDEVAVKRLSTKSRQGKEQFKNEAHLIARLQHKNLVRLLGCCIEKKEQILIYEYMPNKSLDSFLYDSTMRKHLTWPIRVKIVEGIAHGLLYLHKYSRIKIVHRDLKPGNILLDIDMNPKISDFGMARIFSFSRSHENIGRPAGTFGYMSPEYGQQGLFSEKSDVYSFGVLFLEILSGKRNTDSHNAETRGLVAYAWELWISDRGIDLLDPLIQEDANAIRMILRYVHISLLCVQELAADRPNMSQVLAMLCNSSGVLPYPNQPGFLNCTSFGRSRLRPNPVDEINNVEVLSANNVTVSDLEPR